MKRKRPHKHAKLNFKRLAAAFLGATLLSSAMLPGVSATAQAAANPNPDNPVAEENVQTPVDTHNAPNADTVKQVNKEITQSQEVHKGVNAPEHFKKVLNITATAYAPGAHDNDQWGSKTFLGTQIRPGVIAVDPHVIPLGSTVYIQYPDGHGTYAVAEDTGGAIKGHRIDVAKESVKQAQDFGIQHVKVFVVKTPEKA